MILDDDVGHIARPVRQEVHRARHGHGKEALAAAMELRRQKFRVGPRPHEEHDPAPRPGIGLQRTDLGLVEPLDVEKVDAVEAREVERCKRPRRLDARPQAGGGPGPGRQRGRQVERVTREVCGRAGLRKPSVHEQHVAGIDDLQHGGAGIVGFEGIARESCDDRAAAGRRKPRVKPAGDGRLRRNLIDPNSRPRHAVLLEFHLDVANGRLRVVANRHLHRHEHARRRHAPGHGEFLDAQIRGPVRRAGGPAVGVERESTVHEPQLPAGVGKPLHRGGGLFRDLPVAAAEVAHDPDHAGVSLPRGGPLDGPRQRHPRAGIGLRDLERGRQAREAVHEFARQRLPIEVEAGDVIAPFAGQPREPPDRQFLRAAGGRQLAADSLDDGPPPLETAAVARRFPHRVAVVEEDDMRRLRPAEQTPERRGKPRLREHRDHARDRRDPHRQEQELLEHDPRAVFLLARQEELHRGPADVPVLQQVDQVDDHRQGRQRQAPEQQRHEVEGWHRDQTAIEARRERNFTSAVSTGSLVRMSE